MSKSRDNEDLPSVIPRVDWVDGEPVIARTQVIKPSPVPRSLAIILLLLAAFSVGYTFYGQEQRNNDRDRQTIADEADDRRVEGLVEDLQMQQARADTERERLRLLVIGLLAASSPEERRALLEEFVEATADANRDNAAEDEENPPGEPSTNDEGVTESPQSAPAPQPSPRPNDPSPSPSPQPSPEPSEDPPVVNAPPLPLVPERCVPTPIGRICT